MDPYVINLPKETKWYGPKVDYFALGLIVFFLATKINPYIEILEEVNKEVVNEMELRSMAEVNKEENAMEWIEKNYSNSISMNLMDLLSKLLTKDHENRLDLEGIYDHPYTKGYN